MHRHVVVALAVVGAVAGAFLFLLVSGAEREISPRWVLIPLASAATALLVVLVAQWIRRCVSQEPEGAEKEDQSSSAPGVKLRYLAIANLLFPVGLSLAVGLILGNLLLVFSGGVLLGLAGFAVTALVGRLVGSAADQTGMRW